MFEKFIEAFRDRLASSDKIIITTHKNPDGDAMGSSLALMHYLRGLGKDAKVIVPNRYPDFLHWMPGQEGVLDFLADPKLARGLILEADLVCALDFNHPSRAGEVEHALRKTEAPIAMIDHHLNPDDFAQMAWSDPSKCATAEMIFLLLEALEGNTTFTAHVSSCLYAGIITDSGGFRFSNTTPLTLRIGAALMETVQFHLRFMRPFLIRIPSIGCGLWDMLCAISFACSRHTGRHTSRSPQRNWKRIILNQEIQKDL